MKAHFEKHGVTGEHEVHVVNRASGRYDGVMKIDDLVAKNGGNRAKTLTDLKWDHDQGRIQYKAPGGGGAAPAVAAPEKAPELSPKKDEYQVRPMSPRMLSQIASSNAAKSLFAEQRAAVKAQPSAQEKQPAAPAEAEKPAEPDHAERRRSQEHEDVKGIIGDLAKNHENYGTDKATIEHLRSKSDGIAKDIAGKPVSVNKLVDNHGITYGMANAIKEEVKKNRTLKGWTNESRAPQTQAQRINSYLKQTWVKGR